MRTDLLHLLVLRSSFSEDLLCGFSRKQSEVNQPVDLLCPCLKTDVTFTFLHNLSKTTGMRKNGVAPCASSGLYGLRFLKGSMVGSSSTTAVSFSP